MPKLEYYHELEAIPDNAEFIISPGRQLGIGSSLEDALSQPFGLSLMSRLNVIAGAMVTGCVNTGTLVVTGNERAGYPQGAKALLDARFPSVQHVIEHNSPTTLASARHIAPTLRQLVRSSGLIEIIVTTDKAQGKRVADLFADQGLPIRGIAIAHEIAAQSALSEDRDAAQTYAASSRWKRSTEAAKQNVMRYLDPHGTTVERVAKLVRP